MSQECDLYIHLTLLFLLFPELKPPWRGAEHIFNVSTYRCATHTYICFFERGAENGCIIDEHWKKYIIENNTTGLYLYRVHCCYYCVCSIARSEPLPFRRIFCQLFETFFDICRGLGVGGVVVPSRVLNQQRTAQHTRYVCAEVGFKRAGPHLLDRDPVYFRIIGSSRFERCSLIWSTRSVEAGDRLDIFKDSVRTAKETQNFTVTKIILLTLFKEIIAVYSECHTGPVNTNCRILLLVRSVDTYSCHWALRS
jgi:hypothetical protein